MYSITNKQDNFYCHVICVCGRKFRPEEMYICYYCNKILCRFCVDVDFEVYRCRNRCRNHFLNIEFVRKKKNLCDSCLECPVCFTRCMPQLVNGLYMRVCPYCYWNSSMIKFAKAKEDELEILLGQLHEHATKGFLRKTYEFCVKKLKEKGDLIEAEPNLSRASLRKSYISGMQDIVQKAMIFGTWNIDKLNEKLKKEENEQKEKNSFKYVDNYITNQDDKYLAFNAIGTLLACNIDFIDTNFTKFEDIESLKNKLKNELDINASATIKQRLEHVSFQHPIISLQMPKFANFIPHRPKMLKKCKECKKPLVQVDEYQDPRTKMYNMQFRHLFIFQFPIVTIFRIDPGLGMVQLKFSLLNYQEAKISFKEDPDSPLQVELPPNEYQIGTGIQVLEQDMYFYSKSNKDIVLNFKINEDYIPKFQVIGSRHIMRFYLKVEYDRGGGETKNEIEYGNEIRFRVDG